MTLAPQSASCRTQVGPERTRVRSSTVKRDRAWEACGKGIQRLRCGQGWDWRWSAQSRKVNVLSCDRRMDSLSLLVDTAVRPEPSVPSAPQTQWSETKC